MKFPKITSAPLTQLPTDSSELTPQENYIFEKIFQPEIQMFMNEQSKKMALANLEDPKEKHNNKNDHKQEHNHDHHKPKSFKSKFIIAFLFTVILVLLCMSPVPSMISSTMTSSRNKFFIISLVIFIVAFMFIPKFIK